METIDGKQFIIHQIEAKETLYSISRRYKVPVTAILESNPTSEGGITVGKLLKVPYMRKPKVEVSKHVVAAKETLYSIARQYNTSVDELKKANNLTDNGLSLGQELIIPSKAKLPEAPTISQVKSTDGVHIVKAKETMYSISRLYGISVQQLKDWNSLQDELPIGKQLFVSPPKYSSQPSVAAVKPIPPAPTPSPTTVPSPATTPTASTTTPIAPIKISEGVIGTDEVKEAGFAELMVGIDAGRKYLGQHRSIKPGTIIKVRNEATNQEVFVRISSPLPAGASSDIVIRISKSAYDRLGATDPKFRMELTYFK
jgi:LysM repeat protein